MVVSPENRVFIFVSLTGDEQIKVYDQDPETGSLNLCSINNAHGPSGALCLHPSHKFVYDAHVESTSLASFKLNCGSGELSLINKIDTDIGIPAHLAIDSQGRFLLTVYYGGGGITVHGLGEDGSIGDLIQYVDTGEKAHAVKMFSNDRYVFVPHVCPTNKTNHFLFNSETGFLTENNPAIVSPPDNYTGPRHLCFRPKGDIAYIVNEQGNTVTTHSFDEGNGTLEKLQNISTLPETYTNGGATAHIEVHPNGRWAYASNRGHDSIVGFNVADDGYLSHFIHVPVPSSPRSFNIDPSGRYLYCAGESVGIMTAYLINQTNGHLDPIKDYSVGDKPFWVMATTLL